MGNCFGDETGRDGEKEGGPHDVVSCIWDKSCLVQKKLTALHVLALK
jgi:hypothetical protein